MTRPLMPPKLVSSPAIFGRIPVAARTGIETRPPTSPASPPHSIEWGGLAGLVGGLVSIPVLAATGILPKIAGLDTSFGGISGLVIHLLVSVGIGMTYGLLFRNEAPSIGL